MHGCSIINLRHKLYFIVDNEVLRAPNKMPDSSVCNEDFLKAVLLTF